MIKNWLKDIFNKQQSIESIEWRTSNSILNFLSSNIDLDGRLTENAHNLPDEDQDDNKIKWASGLKDAMFGAEDSDEANKRIDELVHHLTQVANKGDKTSEQEFYRLVIESDNLIGIIDQFLEAIVDRSLPIEPFLFPFAKDLATRTDKRNAVKFGIAILGLCQNKSVLGSLKILGLHAEFTVFSTIAISNLSNNPVVDLWDLARKVDGWGKIQLVDRLAALEIDQQIKDWLILDGYKNSIMCEYLALTCAINGELHEKLEKEQIDNKLFKSAADIIGALIEENSPAGDISGYIHAASAIENFIRHARQRALDISDFNTLNRLKDFLSSLQNAIEDNTQNGWDQDIISNCLINIVEILKSTDWKEAALEGLTSKDNATYWNAKQAAATLGIDLWETFWSRLKENPLDSTCWYDVTHYSKSDHSDKIIDFALKHLPLDELATGPKDSLGIGPDYNKYSSLDFIITYLENYPKKGEPIILAGLRSPVTRNRNMAINVLEKWGQENWSAEIENEIYRLREIEPNDSTKEKIESLLKKLDL